MADAISDFVNNILNGKTAGIPNVYLILILVAFGVMIYLYMSKQPKGKEFKPLDLKKETKRRFKREYKYFGVSVNRPMHDVETDKPFAYAIGFMKVVEMKHMKRYEPVYTKFPKSRVLEKMSEVALEIYQKPYQELSDVEKKNVNSVAKEELVQEKVEQMPVDTNTKISRGRKEIKFSQPVPMYMFKICKPSMMSKILARYLGYGIDWAVFAKDQIDFHPDRVQLTASFQRRTPFDIFVFSPQGKDLVQDISFEVERENIWQETANQIPRAVHFDTEASKSLLFRREDAKLEKEKRKSQSESQQF